MNPRERGFLLLTSRLGNPDRQVLSTAQLRMLALRMRGRECAQPEREMTRQDFIALGYDRETAERYLSLVSVLDKAGAYAIQESGEFLVESVDGSIENVIGLPLERLQEELMRLND